MRNSLFLTTLCAAVLATLQAPLAPAATITFTTTMLGANETPPNPSPATGTATVVFDTVARNLTYSLTYANLSAPATAGHIHAGAMGIAGPIILPFDPNPTGVSGTVSGVFTATSLTNTADSGISMFTDLLTAAMANQLYANIHDATYPAGEIRGQLVEVTATPAPTEPTSTPEPTTVPLSGAGLFSLPLLARRRTKRKSSAS